MKPLFILAIGLLLYQYCSAQNRMQPFKTLIGGKWESQRKQGLMVEAWLQANDSTLIGDNYLLKAKGEKHLLESIALVCRNNEYYYIPATQGQNNEKPIRFKIVAFSPEKFIAENAEHDFPKRIIYEFTGEGILHASIDDGNSNSQKKVDFYFSRKKQ